MGIEQVQSTVCQICGFDHGNADEARKCESQGNPKHSIQVGWEYWIPYNGGAWWLVTEQLAQPSHLNHLPGVRIRSPQQGEPQIFDEESLERYQRRE